MKKLLLGFLLAVSAFAAGSVSQSVSPLGRSIVSGQTVVTSFVIQLQWTGDASTGSVPSTVIQNLQQLQGYQITQVQIIPNTPAPTAGYSVKITDVSGYDMLEGQAASSSATAATSYATSSKVPPIVGALNLVVTGNSVAAAQGRVLVYAYKPSVIAAVNLLWTGETSGGGTVTSVFNRTGAVTATSGDYSASQVSNAPSGGIAATDVQAAITELDTEKGAGTVTVVGSGSLGSTQCVTGGGTTTLQTPSANCTVDSSGNLVATSVSTGTAPPTCTAGTAGLICLKEGTAGTGEASAALLYTKTDHLLYANLNNGGEVQVPTATSTATLTNKTLTAPVISTISNTGTLTLPTSTDTLVGKATTDTLTNKTFDTAGTGNSFKINGTAITAVSGTGAVCLASGSSCGGSGFKPPIYCPVGTANENDVFYLNGQCWQSPSNASARNPTFSIFSASGDYRIPYAQFATGSTGADDDYLFLKVPPPPSGATTLDITFYGWNNFGSGNVKLTIAKTCFITGTTAYNPTITYSNAESQTLAVGSTNYLSVTFTGVTIPSGCSGLPLLVRELRDSTVASNSGGGWYQESAIIQWN